MSRKGNTALRPRRRRGFDRALGVTIMVASLLLGFAWNTSTSVAAEPPLALSSSWTDTLQGQYDDAWYPAFIEDPERKVNVDNVVATGDVFSKRALLRGQRDFIVSGTPLNDTDRALAPEKSFIEVPVSVTGFVLTVRAPISVGWRVIEYGPYNEELGDYESITERLYDGPIRVRPSLFLRQLSGIASQSVENLTESGTLRTDLGLGENEYIKTASGSYSPIIMRGDPGALSAYSQEYIRVMEPTLWSDALAYDLVPPGYDEEAWPLIKSDSRSLDNGVVNQLLLALPSGGVPIAGQMTVQPYGRFEALKAKYPTIDLRAAEFKNAADEWVAPTAESILAGVVAGIETIGGETTFEPNAALTDETAIGAYPLTWVNWLMAPTTGLSADKANAVAAIARYVATTGQAANEPFGEATLPQALVDLALERADEIVEKNCTGTQVELVRRNDAGPFAPAPIPGNPPISWCQTRPVTAASTTSVPVAATTSTVPSTASIGGPTTTAVPGTTTLAPSGSNSGSSSRGGSSRRTTTTPTTVAPNESPATTAPPTGDDTASDDSTPVVGELPYGQPVGSRTEFDRTTTMLLGGGGFYVGLRRFRRRSVA